jgi:hypothetical protein
MIDACWWEGFLFVSLCCYLTHFACLYHDVVWEPPTLLLLLPSDNVCLVLLVYWICFFFNVCQQFVVVAQGIQSFEIREIGVVVCSCQQSLTQSGD